MDQGERQYCTPVVVELRVEGGIEQSTSRTIERIAFGESVSEAELQDLLYMHASLLPAAELEPVAEGSVPVAKELLVGTGRLDLLYVNSDGFLTLVETKLWRNPEARRAVIAQIIEYASEMSRWSYEKLRDAVRLARKVGDGDPLMEAVRKSDESFNESAFVDAVSRNLVRGRFLLLIVGDGIQEGIEHLADFLNRTPQLGFTLGLVEMAMFRLDDPKGGQLLVQPRVVARTREVVRAIVEVRGPTAQSAVSITIPDAETSDVTPSARLSVETLLERLAFRDPAMADSARWVFDAAKERGLRLLPNVKSVAICYQDQASGLSFHLGFVNDLGELGMWALPDQCRRNGLPDEIWRNYYEQVARLIPGASVASCPRKNDVPYWQVLVGKASPPFKPLGERKEAWIEAIDQVVERLRQALEKKHQAS